MSTTVAAGLPAPALFSAAVGQEAAAAQLRAAAVRPVHAYLLVGAAGSGGRELARGFAAALLCPHGGDASCSTCRRALREEHPDLVVMEREGASITMGQAKELSRLAARSPLEGERKVLVVVDLHLVTDAAPALLKTIEEPPASAVFVLLAESVPPELVTIASRSVRIDLAPLTDQAVEAALVAEGVDPAGAAQAAGAAGGRLDRARLLAADPGAHARRQLWRSVPDRLDGTGATIANLVDELLAATDTVLARLAQRHEGERAEDEARTRATGERPTSRKTVEDRQRREQRRLRTDELRAGLTTLAGVYRDRLVAGQARAAVFGAIRSANEALIRNPNEPLLLQSLLLQLGA